MVSSFHTDVHVYLPREMVALRGGKCKSILSTAMFSGVALAERHNHRLPKGYRLLSIKI